MNNTFFFTWNKLINIDFTKSPEIIKNLAIEAIQTEAPPPVKQLLVFIFDEYATKKIGQPWFNFLLEEYFFHTCNGGRLFFKQLDEYISVKDIEMIQLYIIALRMGFKGIYNEDHITQYYSQLEHLFPIEQVKNRTIPYQSKQTVVLGNSFTSVFVFAFCCILLNNFLELILWQNMSTPLANIAQNIIGGQII